MRKALLVASLVGLVGLALGQAPADAQVPTASGTPGTPGTPATPAADPLEQTNMYLVQMEAVRGRVSTELARARQEHDVVRALCLSDKLSQIEVAIQSASERRHSLEGAIKRGDTDQAASDQAIIAAFFRRTQELDSEANQCIGKETAYVGDSDVAVTQQPTLPDEDLSEYTPLGTNIEPPSCRSCNR